MLTEFTPNTIVTGGPISATDPESLELIKERMDNVFAYVCRMKNVTKKDLITFLKQQTDIDAQNSLGNFRDEDHERVIEAMKYDQRLEETQDGYYKAVDYHYPSGLIKFEGAQQSLTNSRLVFTETPCCHCPLAN